MKLKAGNKYRAADGTVHGPLYVSKKYPDRFTDEMGSWYGDDGHYWQQKPGCPFSLVAEVTDIHNIDDRRRSWVGSWETERLDYAKLGPEHIGRTVIYQDHGRAEAGTISSWRDGIVFARYSRGDTAAGANAADLVLGVKPLDGPHATGEECPHPFGPEINAKTAAEH